MAVMVYLSCENCKYLGGILAENTHILWMYTIHIAECWHIDNVGMFWTNLRFIDLHFKWIHLARKNTTFREIL